MSDPAVLKIQTHFPGMALPGRAHADDAGLDLTAMAVEPLRPRVFSFHELESDPILQALAYTQVLSAIRRDSLIDEQPRIIAVDEVYRLMRHPSLLELWVPVQFVPG